MSEPRVLLIAGPTASGKSALALALAERHGGVVINADSMQVYRELSILTARPTPADEARAPHRLYGIVSAAEAYSVARWLAAARAEIDAAIDAGRPAIVVGGTGLYFQALTQGLSPIPDVSDAVRAEARALAAELGSAGLHARLAEVDPEGAARLRPSDPQRLIRAWEVWAGTGRPLTHWQALPPDPPGLALPWRGLVLAPERSWLYARCDTRLDAMVAQGALDEVRTLADLDPTLPARRALGVPELLRHVQGEIDLETALSAARTATRRYAKRQLTWLRNKMVSWIWQNTQQNRRFDEENFPFVSEFLLTGR
jgi:tRNA dimethylallyltransferase